MLIGEYRVNMTPTTTWQTGLQMLHTKRPPPDTGKPTREETIRKAAAVSAIKAKERSQKLRDDITDAIRSGKRTAPEIAAVVGRKPSQTRVILNGMLKDGRVELKVTGRNWHQWYVPKGKK